MLAQRAQCGANGATRGVGNSRRDLGYARPNLAYFDDFDQFDYRG